VVSVPVQAQVFEGGRSLGATGTGRIRLSPGPHDLQLINDALHYRVTEHVEVASGRVLTLNVTPPSGTLSVNAVPWAEVLVDGRSLGQTPLGNVPVPIGPHRVVFRHPKLGERQQSISVVADGPTRVGVDFTVPATNP
jgi:hypothetical protein